MRARSLHHSRRPVMMLGAGVVAAAMIMAGCTTDSTASNNTSATSTSARPDTVGKTTTTAPEPSMAGAAAAGSAHVHVNELDGTTRDPDRPTIVEFNGPDRAKYAEQVTQARKVALRYPTLADAQAAGYKPTTPYAPGTGSHMGREDQTQQAGKPFNIELPQSYMYDGDEPNSRVVGMMYIVVGADPKPPEGFVGPLDTWRGLDGECLKPGTMEPLFPVEDVSKEKCLAGGGQYIPIKVWILHAWLVPGWEAPEGAFAPFNDDIVCADGTENADPVKGCASPVKW